MSLTSPASLDSELPPPPPTLDSVLAKLGNPGKYQVVLMLLLATNYIPVVVNHLLMAFYSAKVPFHCKVAGEGEKSLYIPHTNSSQAYHSCQEYRDPTNHSLGTQQCSKGHTFIFQGESEWTVTAEWDLVCDRAYLAPLVTTTYFCGVMLGGVIFGSLSDRFGRKWIMLLCLYSQCLIGIGLHFVQRLLVFMSLRFLQGIVIQGLQCVSYSMIMELFCPSYRTLAGCVAEAFWAAGIIILSLVAKYVQHWRYIQLAINIPTLATLLYIWIIPESLRWLLSKGKVKKAEVVAKSYIGYNSLKLDPASLRLEMESVSRDLVSRQDARRPPDITDILRVPVLRKRACILFFVWFSVSICYYGITYYVPNLFGDRHLNFILGGGIELAAYLLAFVVLGGFGRRAPLCIYLMLSGVLCISMVLVKHFLDTDLANVPAIVTALALIGKAAVVSCFCIIFLYSSEVFPTVIRTVGMGSCTFFGRVGSLLAPQVLLLGEFLFSDMPGLIPFLLCGSLCLVAALMVLYLPETLNTKLPDTIEEAVAQASKAVPATRAKSTESLDVGYGKCPEFVCVDGLIVSKDHGWTDTDTTSHQGTLSTLRSITHDYEQVQNLTTDGETEPESGMFKNLSYMEQEDSKQDQVNTYSQIMRNNEELLASHLRVNNKSGSESSDNDTSHLVTSQSEMCSSLTSQDSSIVSADHSIIYHSHAKDRTIKELLKQKIILFDSNETRL